MKQKKKPARGRIRIAIVDDHPMMRQGLAQLINNEPDLTVCAEADTAGQALELLNKARPGLWLIDISLPDKNGIELIKDIRAMDPASRILVVSMHDESLYAERILRAGARGYIMKQEGGKKLMEAIRHVLAGNIYVSEKMSGKILEIFSGQRDTGGSPVARLTDREFEVFQLIGEGKGTRQIAEHLHLSVKTVEVHRANIKEKLGLKTATDLVRYAVRWTESQTGV
ncbi:MAG TPA: response regulator transcription factor [Verrucomicrobia bacterium]|nr:response regulator transcription factor [Verrucomicrobiota bacterium]HOP96138.1 response regulator transcription factor [Verrucomicrobiota bacterium]